MVSNSEILEALKVIEDPDLKRDIVSLGFVKNIQIKDASVSFDIELTTPACPIKDQFKQTAENIVSQLDGVHEVKVSMTSRKRPSQLTQKSGLKEVANIIAIASCKGGVGKSTVAANIALELAGRGFKIGLLDTDLFGPSVPTLFNVHRPAVMQDQNEMILPVMHDKLKLMSFGFLVAEGPVIMRGPMVSGHIQQILHGVAWGELDYLILDLPPGTGDIQLTITQAVKLTGAVIVTTRQSLSLVDVAKGIQMFEKVSVPMLGIVENMAYFECDNCTKKHYIFGGEGKTTLTERFGLETLVEIPIDKKYTEGLSAYRSSPLIKDMVDNMVMSLGRSLREDRAAPVVTKDEQRIHFAWSDGRNTSISHFDLRLACKCAECVDENSGTQVLQKKDVDPHIVAEQIRPIGLYAIGIDWSDGHSSGIYSYQMLQQITS